MLFWNMLLLKILLFCMLTGSSGCTGNRTKRIINGARVSGRKGPYDVVRYLVAFGTVHGVPWFLFGFVFDFIKSCCSVYGHINCTGALLTPSIIQTACHCVATFYPADPRRPDLNHHWEGVKVVYIGINDRFGEPFSMQTRPPVKSKRFFVHNRCQTLPRYHSKLPLDSPVLWGLTHDFGYIIIDPSWIDGKIGVPTTNVAFAPIYTSKELSRIFDLYTKTSPVCLHMGYGAIDDDGSPTEFIRSGWSQMTNEKRCLYYTTYNFTKMQIEKYKSWVCTEKFPIHNQPVNVGDSGSPVTCNNVYFAVASAVKTIKTLNNHKVGKHDVIVLAEHQNAIEYRRGFEEEVKKLDASRDSYVSRFRDLIQNVMPVRRISPPKSMGLAQEMSGTERSAPITLLGLSAPAILLMVAAIPF